MRHNIKVMNIKRLLKHSLLTLAAACVAASCTTPKNVAYFQDSANAQIIEIANSAKAITVQPHDKLTIIVTSKDPALARPFNLNIYTNRTAQNEGFNGVDLREYNLSSNEGISTYTVAGNGTIDFPHLGSLRIEGMTRSEVAGFIKGELMGKNLLKDPIVTVEFLNTGVSVLGEVNRPGRYDLNTDVLTLPEALALAGDLTIQGLRENVIVMRKDGDKVETYRADLTNTESLLKSPAFYLKQGDVIYVEPNNMRKRQTTNNGNNLMNVSFWISVASLLTSAAVLIK